jgi:F-type H+-transporting ATPase subunit epsilon
VSGFALVLQDATHAERFEEVASFIGEDSSGSFGILAGHGRMLTVLAFGLARFRYPDGPWHFIALPGGVLSFMENELTISTRRYLWDLDHRRIGKALDEELRREENDLSAIRENLRRLEQEMLKSLWNLERNR